MGEDGEEEGGEGERKEETKVGRPGEGERGGGGLGGGKGEQRQQDSDLFCPESILFVVLLTLGTFLGSECRSFD